MVKLQNLSDKKQSSKPGKYETVHLADKVAKSADTE